ncbi:MAG: nucleotidyltransferase domain-containing protein [Anaerolineae bacterium]
MKVVEDELRQKIVERYSEALGSNLVALAFFGSYARGDSTEWSDIDLLLIASELPQNPFERQGLVKMPLLGLGAGPLAVLARTVEEFTADVSPLHLDLAEDAIIFYDPQGFLASRLARVRALIQEAGLVRQRTAQGLVWWWEAEPPKPGWSLTWEGFKP